MTRRRHRAAATLLVAVLAAGCTVGPDFRRPEPEAPTDWAAARALIDAGAVDLASRPVARAFDGHRWWSVFGDAQLDALVDEAVRQNLDLQTAAARIAEARARRELAAGSELPTVGLTGLAGRERMSENGIASTLGGGSSGSSGSTSSSTSSSPSLSSNLFQAGFDALWEIDLWGKTRRDVEAAGAGIDSAERARGDAQVSLTAEVARNYLMLRGTQRQRAIVEADIAAQTRLLALIDSQATNGLAARADVQRQAAQLAQVRAQLPPLAQTLEQALNRLALLLALPPGELRQRLGSPDGSVAPLPPEVPIGLPGELLRRRPDVLRSEAELHAATARVGVAQAQLYPSVELGAVAGFQTTAARQLSDWGSRFFAAGAQVSMPLFQGGRLKAQVRVADAQLQEALLGYRTTVLNAFHDADDALVAYAEEQRHAAALAEQTTALERSRTLVADRYRNGLAPFNDVLLTESQLRQAQLAALQSNVTASTDLVALYKALGGDWTDPAR